MRIGEELPPHMRGGSFVGNEESLQACAICLCLTGILQARSLSLRFCLSLSYTSSISRRRLPTCHHCPSSSPPRARCSIKSLASCTHCSCVSRTRLSSSSSRCVHLCVKNQRRGLNSWRDRAGTFASKERTHPASQLLRLYGSWLDCGEAR